MKKQILAGVEFSNLLQINWNEQKIQTNFKLIVDALADHQRDRKEIRDDVELLKDEIAFLKGVVKDANPSTTNHNINVEHVEGNKDASSDPFKIREMLQKIQKEVKDLSGKQSDTEMLLDKIQQVQEKLKEDLRISFETKEVKEQNAAQTSNVNLARQQSKQRISNTNIKGVPESDNSAFKKRKEAVEEKQKPPTSIKEIDENALNKNGPVAQVLQSNRNINAQLSDLLEKIEQLRSDNFKINAKLSSHDQSIQALRKAPVPSKLRSSQPKVTPDSTKTSQQKTATGDKEHNAKMEHQNEILKEDIAALEDQLNKYYLDANTLRLCYEEMKLWISDLKKSDNKKDGSIHELNAKIDQLVQNHRDDKDRIDQQLKELRTTLLKSALQEQKAPEPKPETPSVIPTDRRISLQELEENYKDKINDRLSRLQALLMQAATQADLERVRGELKQGIQDSNNKIQNVKLSVSDINKRLEENQLDQQSQNSEIKKLQSDLAGLAGLVNDKFAAGQKKNSITGSKIQDVKKNLQQLKEDLEFYKENFNKPATSAHNQLPTTTKEENGSKQSLQGRNSVDLDKRKSQELRKELLNKLHDNKTELFNALKDFERKTNNKNTFQQDIAMLFDKIGQIKLFLNKKADAEDTKKSIIYLEKKISVAFSSLANEDQNTEDARAAKKNWFCLSCDKVLQNYNGKVGKHIVWDALGTNKFSTKTNGFDENRKPKQTLPVLKK